MSLTDFLKKANKQFGSDVIRRYGDDPLPGTEAIPTGSMALDIALGVGGWPRGRTTEILGNPGSGKTTMALHAIAEAQKLGLEVLFVDAEHALDPLYAISIGVDMDNIHIVQPRCGEEALDVSKMAVEEAAFGLIVIDSVAALVPLRELEGEMGDSHIGLQARMLHKFTRSISGSARLNNVAMMYINQYRASMNTMGFGGPSKIAAAGSALEYATSIKADVARIKSLKGKGNMTEAHRTRVRIVKNKIAPPFKEAEFDIIFGIGINKPGELVDMAVDLGIVKKGGAWYTYGEYKIQGRDQFVRDLNDIDDLRGLIENDIRQNLDNTNDAESEDAAVSD